MEFFEAMVKPLVTLLTICGTLAAVPLELPPHERARIVLFTTLAILWFFWLGAALGSYLNVIVYRMPLGVPSVAPDSRCPKCQERIRWYDNIPIFGWLLLRGRCRNCQEPIAPRYLLVELLLGSLFVALLCLEVLSGGAVFPTRPRRAATSLPIIEHVIDANLLAIYFHHAAVVWFVVGGLLFWTDGNRIPKRFLAAGVMVLLLPPLLWPSLRHIPFLW